MCVRPHRKPGEEPVTSVIPALIAGLCCGVAGSRYGAVLRRQAASLKRWEELLRHLSLLLGQGEYPLPACLEHVATTAQSPDEQLRRIARLQRTQPLASLDALYQPERAPEADIVTRCLRRISAGSAAERSLAATQAADEIGLMYASVAPKAAVDAKMWTSLGWTIGASLMLMLL